MSYRITEYTKSKARDLGVEVRPSSRADKKIDVYVDGRFQASIGGQGYGDYPTFLAKYGREYADERRRLFYIRHARNIAVKFSPAWYSAALLW